MVSKLQKDNKGFTIIEVLIVLAIAGLIMLIVFLAIPALQRNQRNNARNSEASRISSAVTECLANRNGVVGSCDGSDEDETKQNLGIEEEDGVLRGYQRFESIEFNTVTAAEPIDTSDPDYTEINLTFGYTCSSDGTETEAGTTREFVVTWVNEPEVARCIGSEAN